MSEEIDESKVQRIAAHQELETRNARAAITYAEETRKVLTERMDALQGLVNTMTQKLQQLEQKYNLLLTRNFKGGSTSGE